MASAERANELLVLRRPHEAASPALHRMLCTACLPPPDLPPLRQAVWEAASFLNTLACPNCPPPEEADGARATLPALLPLPVDDELAHERSGHAMAVLLQSLCELGEPQLAEEAVRTCYMDVACAPFEVIWYSAQALASQEQQPTQAAEALVVDWLCASPPPRTLTAERRRRLLRLLLFRVLPPAAARRFLREPAPGVAPAEELAVLEAELNASEQPLAPQPSEEALATPTAAAEASATAPGRAASSCPAASRTGGPSVEAAHAAPPAALAALRAAAAAAAAWLSHTLQALGPEAEAALLAPLCVALVALAAKLVLPKGWYALLWRRWRRLCLPLLLPLRLALGAGTPSTSQVESLHPR